MKFGVEWNHIGSPQARCVQVGQTNLSSKNTGSNLSQPVVVTLCTTQRFNLKVACSSLHIARQLPQVTALYWPPHTFIENNALCRVVIKIIITDQLMVHSSCHITRCYACSFETSGFCQTSSLLSCFIDCWLVPVVIGKLFSKVFLIPFYGHFCSFMDAVFVNCDADQSKKWTPL